MTYIPSLDPNSAENEALAAAVAYFDEVLPGWQERVEGGIRFLSEDDFPVYDTSADDSRVSNEDWEAMAEDLWNDDKFM